MYETTYTIFDVECTVLFFASGKSDEPYVAIEDVEFDKTNLSKEDLESIRLEILDNWSDIRETCARHYLSGKARWTDPVASKIA